jgi:hypothetical protein
MKSDYEHYGSASCMNGDPNTQQQNVEVTMCERKNEEGKTIST